MKSTKKAETAATTATIAVFAKSMNVVEAIIQKADLDPKGVHIILADDSNPDAYKEMAAFPGAVYSTQLQDQRLGKGQVKVPLFPKGSKNSALGGSALAKKLASANKNKEWEKLRDPNTAPEVIVANMGDPVKVIGVELNSNMAEAFDLVKDLINATIAQAATLATTDDEKLVAQEGQEAFDVLLNMLGV